MWARWSQTPGLCSSRQGGISESGKPWAGQGCPLPAPNPGWPVLLFSLHDRPMYQRQGVETRNMTLLGKPGDQEDNRLMSQNNQLFRV